MADRHKLSPTRRAMLLGLAYLLSAVPLISWTRFEGSVAFIWVGNALLLAELSLQPQRRWPLPILACLLANWAAMAMSCLTYPLLALLAPINMAEAVLGAWLLRRLMGGSGYFESMGSVMIFLLVAGAAVPAGTALVGAAVLSATMNVGYWDNWLYWFAGRGLGVIVVAPIAMMVISGEARLLARRATPQIRREAALLIGVMALVTTAVFGQSHLPLLFLPMLPLVIATFRLGGPGAGLAIAMLALIGGCLTVAGYGPISLIAGTTGMRANFFQFYLAVAVMTVLPIGAELKQRRRLFLQLRENEARYRLIADNMSDIVLHLGLDGTIRYASPSIRSVGGFDAASVIGRVASELVVEEDRAQVIGSHLRAIAAPDTTVTIEYRAATASGELRWFETHTRAFADEHGEPSGVVSVIRDIHRRKTLEQELSRAAATDPLTGLANRRAFVDRLDRVAAEVRSSDVQACVAIFDVDFFKRVNDRHGHAVGDLVLKEIAQRARSHLRAGDLVARIGGEEFGVVLADTDIGEAQRVCDRLREAIGGAPIAAGEGDALTVTVSIGVAPIGRRGTTADVLRAADRALYAAKADGRDCLRLAA